MPKTLIFAKDDAHAENIVEIVREDKSAGLPIWSHAARPQGDGTRMCSRQFGKGNDYAQKITYRTTGAKPKDLINEFRTSPMPRIAATVDMIATGTDIKAVEVVMVMRAVKSRAVFEQMKGRGVRVIKPDDLQSVTPDAKAKDHFVIVDAVDVCEQDKNDSRPMEQKPTVSFEKLMQAVTFGNSEDDVFSSLAGPLARKEHRLSREDDKKIRVLSGDLSVKDLSHRIVALDRAKGMVQSFEQFIAEHKDEITALQVLYSRPCKDRLTFEAVEELADAIEKPPYLWNESQLWNAYAALEKSKVKGTSGKRILSDLVSLVRFAMHQDNELIPFPERVNANFKAWLATQTAGTEIVGAASAAKNAKPGKQPFTEEQLKWLEMIRDHIAANLGVEPDDFEYAPFSQHGGLGKVHQLFGDKLDAIIEELNETLAA